jgi:uncharacterized protein YegL
MAVGPPGGALATRPLHFIWICDCSGSMSFGGKIQALNNAIREAIPHMRQVAEGNANARVLVRALRFSSTAHWHIGEPTAIEDFEWTDLPASGETAMGAALGQVAEQLKIPPMTDHALPPVLALVSDGQPTDDFAGGLRKLMNLPWGRKAVRVAIAIGEDADFEVLEKFIGNPALKPLQANNPETLVSYIRWISTEVIQAASQPPSQVQTATAPQANVPLPMPPDPPVGTSTW